MKRNNKIITIGLSGAWDITCMGEGLYWGCHKVISESSFQPAGKALNISKALAWLGGKSTAAGLWGNDDLCRMEEAIRPLGKRVKVKMTAVPGATRQNITVIDTAGNKEMHLRSLSELASKKALRRLKVDLDSIVTKHSTCVFAGSMPEGFLGEIIRMINWCYEKGAKIAIDTSGKALKTIVSHSNIWLIKPNVQELGELLGRQTYDRPASLAKAGAELLDKIDIVLISRGRKGAVVVNREGVQQGHCCETGVKALSTVACGDYLLAGFLKGLKDKGTANAALETAIKVATARAWGWAEKKQWRQVQHQIKVKIGGV